MKKFYFAMVLISIAVATVSTSANGKSTLQTDIDAGATPLTTSQITSVYTNNTIVDSGYYVYYSEGGKKTVLNTKNNKKYKRKWQVDETKGLCQELVRKKKWVCDIVWKIGPNKYRFYDEKGKEIYTASVEKGNIKGLE